MNNWTRSKNENIESVLDYLIYYRSLLLKTKKERFIIMTRFRKNRADFEKVNETCRSLGVPVSLFIDVLFAPPLAKQNIIENFQFFVTYLGSNTAREIFISRVNAYRKRMGALDNVFDYVHARSVTNLDNWFENSFWEGYWLFHRLMDKQTAFPIGDIFSIFEAGPEFTPMFILTHPRWQEFRTAREVGKEILDKVAAKVRQDAVILDEPRYRMRFMEARERCRNRAQSQIASRKDARWESLWKILG